MPKTDPHDRQRNYEGLESLVEDLLFTKYISEHLASGVDGWDAYKERAGRDAGGEAKMQIYSSVQLIAWIRLHSTFGNIILFKALFPLLDLKLVCLAVVWNYGPTLFDVSYFNEKMDSSNLMKVISMQLANGRGKNVWKCGIEVGASTIIRPMSDHFFPSSDHSFPSDQNFNSSNYSLVSLSYLSMYASIKVTQYSRMAHLNADIWK